MYDPIRSTPRKRRSVRRKLRGPQQASLLGGNEFFRSPSNPKVCPSDHIGNEAQRAVGQTSAQPGRAGNPKPENDPSAGGAGPI